MSVKIGILFICLSFQALALVPVEGLILGATNTEYQLDPLAQVFRPHFDSSNETENYKVFHYQNLIRRGLDLDEGCANQPTPRYVNSWQEKQAQRAITATAQYIGLDLSTKALGAYAQQLKISEADYNKLADNLVANYCSKNITVYSLKLLRSSMTHYYKNPVMSIIPSIATSPYASTVFKSKTETPAGHRNEMNLAIKNFRAFCSWGNDVSDYRMLVPYLKNKFFMSEVMRNSSGFAYELDDKSASFEVVRAKDPVQVTCNNLICRKASAVQFAKEFPRTVGSTGVFKDMRRLYCHHYRFQDFNNDTIPQVKKWIKEAELEDPILETSFLLSLISGVPDPLMGTENYSDLPVVARSNFNDRWSRWAENILSTFSTDLLFEESLKIQSQPQRDRLALRTKGFALAFTVTLGEMDRLMNDTDKFKLSFDLKLTKNYMRFLRTRWIELSGQVDNEGKIEFKKEVSRYLELQIGEKEKLFSQKMWNQDFSRLITEELLEQVQAYRGPMFDTYREELLTIPVNFSYGVFALGYLRYRSDLNAGRLKLNL